MPLDTSTYALALLRLDGRRWNELRRLHGQIRTQAAANGSSYFELGNTKVICTVTGPAEIRRSAAGGALSGSGGGGVAGGGGGVGGGGGDQEERANIVVEVNMAGFSTMDRKKRSRADRRTVEMQNTISSTFSATLFTHLVPRSTITITLQILAQDGALLAACINAATLALIDAGIETPDYVVACTAGSTAAYAAEGEAADPLLDLNGTEELELPFLTVATLGATDQVVALVMESRVPVGRVEGMLAVAVDGCKQVRGILNGIVHKQGRKFLESRVN